MKSTEKEISFLINPNRIDKILKIINEIGGRYNFVTGKEEIQSFTDFYFDKDNLDLGKRKIALRLRVFNDKTYKITLKKTGKNNELFSERLEIEDYFSKNILISIIQFLNTYELKFDVNVIEKFEFIDSIKPKFILKDLGFSVIQTRNTERKLINLYKDSEIFYEFVIDSTSFLFQNNEFKYTSMEIESKSSMNTEQKNKELVSLVMNQSDENLFKIWKYNKLITGFAIKELFYSGILTDQHKDNNGYLENTAVDIIEKYLQKMY